MNVLEFPYFAGFTAKKYYSLLLRKRLPFPVVSVGNITVGGTGKTPATIAIAGEAMKRGFFPVILTRGYLGKAAGPCFVSRGEGPLLDSGEAGDEPFLMAEKLRGVPIVKGSNRYEGGIFAFRELANTSAVAGKLFLFLLDDGFQHRRLYRDRDIVLIDAANPFGNGRLLPFGRLREPLKSLGDADIIVLTKTGGPTPDARLSSPAAPESAEVRSLVSEVRRYNLTAPIFLSSHAPVYLTAASGERYPVAWLSGKKIYGFCALGNPDSFRKTLEDAGAEVMGFRAFRDHYRYESGDIERVLAEAERCGAGWIVTTEKDIIKVRKFAVRDNVLSMGIEFSVEDAFFDEIFKFNSFSRG